MSVKQRKSFKQDMEKARAFNEATLAIIRAIQRGKLKMSAKPAAKFLNDEVKKIIKKYEFSRD